MNTASIALINLLLGWSLVGWVVALVMSASSDQQPVIQINTAVVPQAYAPQPSGPQHLARPPYTAPPMIHPPRPGAGYGQPEPTVILPPQHQLPPDQAPPGYR